MPISRQTEQKLEDMSALVMVISGALGIVTLLMGLIGPGIALLLIAIVAFYLADLGRS